MGVDTTRKIEASYFRKLRGTPGNNKSTDSSHSKKFKGRDGGLPITSTGFLINLTETLQSESPNRVLEDWELSLADLHTQIDSDSLDLHSHYADHYEIDSDIYHSEEFYVTRKPKHSSPYPWRAQARNIPPLYINIKRK